MAKNETNEKMKLSSFSLSLSLSLGMHHDGENQCDPYCCIMSPTIGNGQTVILQHIRTQQLYQCILNEFEIFCFLIKFKG